MSKKRRSKKQTTPAQVPESDVVDGLETDEAKEFDRTAISPHVVIFLSLPILAYGVRILATGNLLGLQDWDWFFSHYEAVRRSIVDHGQFPWWNPWSAGGAPLFADPQVGLVSIQMPLVLLFGTVIGLKIGVVVYLLAGFWGMYFLLSLITEDFWRKVLLSYLFVSSTFVMFHYTAGHYTFLLYLLVPWLVWIYLYQQGTRGWLIRFSLFAGFFVNTAPHYIALQTVLWMTGLFLVMAYHHRDQLTWFVKSHTMALLLVVPLVIPKTVFALEYVGDFPRAVLHNPSLGLLEAIKAIAMPAQSYAFPSETSKLGTWEISAYVGVLTIALFIGLVGFHVTRYVRTKQKPESLLFVFSALAAVAFLVGLGPFAPFSPWSLMTSLPVLESMQVPSRWFGWTILFVLLAIGSVRTLPRWTLILLAISLLELTAMNLVRDQPFILVREENVEKAADVFEQFDVYPRTKDLPYETTFMAMSQNYGEVRAYEPLLGNNQLERATARRGINDGYPLLTDNAQLLEWSPNKIQFKRIGPGEIFLNANVGRWWTINGEYMFSEMRVTEPTVRFPVPENAPAIITLQCKPQRAWTLAIPLITLAGILILMQKKFADFGKR